MVERSTHVEAAAKLLLPHMLWVHGTMQVPSTAVSDKADIISWSDPTMSDASGMQLCTLLITSTKASHLTKFKWHLTLHTTIFP